MCAFYLILTENLLRLKSSVHSEFSPNKSLAIVYCQNASPNGEIEVYTRGCLPYICAKFESMNFLTRNKSRRNIRKSYRKKGEKPVFTLALRKYAHKKRTRRYTKRLARMFGTRKLRWKN